LYRKKRCNATYLAFTKELQELMEQNADDKQHAWAQLLLAFDHLGMFVRQVEIPGNNLIVGGVMLLAALERRSKGTRLPCISLPSNTTMEQMACPSLWMRELRCFKQAFGFQVAAEMPNRALCWPPFTCGGTRQS
jgi:hypothetical protein